MIDHTSTNDRITALEQQAERLQRRVERERTARMEAERIAEDGMRALYLANSDLDARILERTQQLDEALATATVASRAKSAFLAHMSHHLMTPLNGVVGMLELLGDADFEDHQSTWHASAMRSANRLDRLVRQLLLFVEVDGADLRRSSPTHRLSDVLEAVEAQWHQPMLRSGQLPMFEVVEGRDLWIPAPPELSVLFSELFSNIVEHADPGPVLVCLRVLGHETVAIDVEDAGPGITPEMREMARSLGVRGDLERIADASTGLGLVLMKRIAEALGGQVHLGVMSPTTITVEIPLAIEEAV